MSDDFLLAVFLIIALALSVLGLIGAIINIPRGISRSIRDEINI